MNYKKEIYWVSQSVHRCLKYSSSSVKCFVGNGRCGYSVSNSLGSCFLNSPSGICCNKNSIYISDTGNGCLRRVDENSINLIGGVPNSNDLSSPLKIKIKDNMCYVLDDGCIKNIILSNNKIGATYFRKGIISFDIDKRGNLIILERRN